jgi:hypothetical protein
MASPSPTSTRDGGRGSLLDELVRDGAWQRLAAALQAEVAGSVGRRARSGGYDAFGGVAGGVKIPVDLRDRVRFHRRRVVGRAWSSCDPPAALLYTPADDVRGLDSEPLLSEAPVAVLPKSHPLARRPSLRMADLECERLHKYDPTDASAVGGLSELMHLIALGRKVAVLPQSLTTPLRDDLTTVPVIDIPPSVLVLAWPAHSTSPSVAALARAAAKVAAEITEPSASP